jgi:Ca-activated chloride channel family protein
MTMIKFEDISFLYGLLAIPVFFVMFYLMMQQRKKRLKKLGELKLVKRLMPELPNSKLWWKFGIYSLAYTLLIFGMANPQIGSKLEKVERQGVDLMVALDVSNSMLAEDIKPNRLERAKRAISKLVDNLQGDRIGIVVFAGRAYTQLPITSDYSAAKLFINTIDTDVVPSQGTSIGQAISLSMEAFEKSEHEKAIVIITDGEDHEDDPVAAAEEAVKIGVRVYTIGIGLPEGAPIPVYSNGRKTGFKKDLNGKTVVTKLDEITLQKVAAAGKGIYVRANNTAAGLKDVFERINKMEKQKYESRIFSDYEDRYQYLLALVLIILVLEQFITDKRSKWAGRFNIFETKKDK